MIFWRSFTGHPVNLQKFSNEIHLRTATDHYLRLLPLNKPFSVIFDSAVGGSFLSKVIWVHDWWSKMSIAVIEIIDWWLKMSIAMVEIIYCWLKIMAALVQKPIRYQDWRFLLLEKKSWCENDHPEIDDPERLPLWSRYRLVVIIEKWIGLVITGGPQMSREKD